MARTKKPKPPKQLKGRSVVCHATGVHGNSLDFYKAPDGLWYQSEEVYQQKITNLEYYHKVVDCLADIMGYQPGAVFPTAISKGLTLFKAYGYETVMATLEECRSTIEFSVSARSFGSDYQKASYIMAILKNNINDVARKLKAKKEFEARQAASVAAAPSMQDFTSTAKATDISSFLEGGD